MLHVSLRRERERGGERGGERGREGEREGMSEGKQAIEAVRNAMLVCMSFDKQTNRSREGARLSTKEAC